MRAIGKLDHPAIVRATDAGQVGETHFLVMELVAGVDLGQLVRTCGKLEVADACQIVLQAAMGVQYAHEHGIVHRDLKPSNVMLTGEGQVKILDLGLAMLSDPPGVDELTTVGQLLGTLDYMAPEQCDDSPQLDHRMDIYGLGATLYKLLSGQSPYAGPSSRSPLQKLKSLATLPVPPIQQRDVAIPQSLADVVHRALARQPADRYSTAAELAEALERFAQGHNLAGLGSVARAILVEQDRGAISPGLEGQAAEVAPSMQPASPSAAAAEPPVPPDVPALSPAARCAPVSRPRTAAGQRSPESRYATRTVGRRRGPGLLVGLLAAGALAAAGILI
jgi:serine/threonine protein kinase